MQSSIRNSVGALLLLLASASAYSQTAGCIPITGFSTPSITTPGTYCLAVDLPGGLWIGSSDVVIDLQGHTLDGSAAGPGTTGDGISAFNNQRITVRNGTIRGFRFGINLGGSGSGHVVENVRLDRNYWNAVSIRGQRTIVRNNTITATGGSADTSPNSGGSPMAITVDGELAQITDNVIMDTVEAAGADSHAILAGGQGAVIERNTIKNASFGPGTSTGIFAGNGSVVAGNRVLNMRTGIQFRWGDRGLYKDNIVGGATTAYVNGIAVGTTNVSF